ncbi:MAG: class I SAM-dependent methyltransferase [Cyclobacteriaceae bacterium]|nr:class I SAM-dependent methyltransferase [Cyclobacteriaceae bacterium]
MTTGGNKDTDPEGQITLEVISEAHRFNRWMYETIEPFCTGKILEIGSGIGNISAFFLEAGHPIVLSDIRKNYIEHLERQFSDHSNLLGIVQMDLVDPDFMNKNVSMLGTFDTLFALNVVEHIQDDHLAIQNACALLRKGGTLIILVPAFNFLYNQFDRSLGHYRRYTRKSLKALLVRNNLKTLHSRYFNLAGTFGWFVSGKLQKNNTIPGRQMKLYNRLVPAFKMLDKLVLNNAGLSVIAVGRK